MADSDQDKQTGNDFDDDLDKMFQDDFEQISTDDEVLDDKDAIDRLLEESQEEVDFNDMDADSVDDLVDSLLDDVVTEQVPASGSDMEEIDEFADEPEDLPLAEAAIDDVVDRVQASEPSPDADVEIDEFAEDDPESELEGSLNLDVDSEAMPGIGNKEESADTMSEIDEFADDDEDDFLLADFDISADAEESSGAADEQQGADDSVAEPAEATVVMTPEPAATQSVDYSSEINAQNEKIRQLEGDLSELQQAANSNDALEKMVRDQKKASREAAEASHKLKILSITGLVLGVLALIVSIVVVVLNFGVQDELEEMQSTVLDIEDRLAIPVLDPNDKKIEALQLSVQSLKSENKLLSKKLAQIERQAADKNIEATEHLEAKLDKQLLDVTDKVTALEAKIASTKMRTKRTASTRKVIRKAKIHEWAVNLVSFKQRWYTDKKVAEFKQKGIPAEVIAVDVKGVEWYRIRVVGFKSKIEAGSYAVKMKKSLNLSSVWVSLK